jgi:hypothetical protein
MECHQAPAEVRPLVPVELRVACRCAMFGHPHYHGKDSRIAAARKWNAEVRDEKDRVPYPEEGWA